MIILLFIRKWSHCFEHRHKLACQDFHSPREDCQTYFDEFSQTDARWDPSCRSHTSWRKHNFISDTAQVTNQHGVFDLNAAYFLIESGQHIPVLEISQLLQNVDLSLLATIDEKLSFFGNLTNLLTLHALLKAIQALMELVSCFVNLVCPSVWW